MTAGIDPRPMPWWLLATLLGVSLTAPAFGQRTYWPVTVDSLATGHVLHTHVQTTGLVTLVRHEGDGDTHIKLVGKVGFVVCECIPVLPCRIPKVGEHITVRGISRWDGEHKWNQIHPVEELTRVPP